MAQKVQFIAAVVHDPEIIFFDEPFAGIDPVAIDVLRAALVELARTGKTILFSTHMMEQAERICERVHIIDQAGTVLDGRLSEIKDRFGTRTIHVEADGDASFLRDDPAVAQLTGYPNYLEIEPAAGSLLIGSSSGWSNGCACAGSRRYPRHCTASSGST